MPAEPRRSSRKLTSEEDVELKRARGEISCAECRRLKLKCDKKLPCGSCVRRGCTTICPNGSLSSGQGTRFILADTDQLHRKIAEMSERIRQLEDALAIFQAGVSSERHPLLRDELLSIKFGPEVRRTIDDEHSRNTQSQSIDALGTLTIGTHGETKFIGRSGGSETLFMSDSLAELRNPEDPQSEEDLEYPELSQELENLSITFPLTVVPDGIDAVLDKLEAQLPSRPRAWALCEAYIEHFTWFFRPVKRDELIDDILTPIYKSLNNPSKPGYRPPFSDGRCPHILAVLYFVLAIGALVDLTLPACSGEAEKYYQLGRAALSLRSVFDSPEIETVQALAFMAAYHSLASSRYSVESAWSLISLASKSAQGLGLHRDSSQWRLEPKTVQRRRNLFWEIFIFENTHCMALGRPPAVSLAHIDCELPQDEESTLSESGDILRGFWAWKHHFTQEVYTNVVDKLLSAKAPTYETVLDLDRQIRQASIPSIKLYLKPEEDDYNNPGLCMRSYLMSQYRSIMMLGIHRTFFAQALLDHPTNPLRSPYAPSFLAANRCASVLIKSFLHHFERCPDLCGRYWNVWTHAFTAAIILGSTVSRCPSATMAPSSLIELDLALDVFKKGSAQSMRARKAVPILRALKERATKIYQQFRNRHISPQLDIQLNIGPEDDSAEDRLAIFGGQTRVMSSKLLSRKKSPKLAPASPSAKSNANGMNGMNGNSGTISSANGASPPQEPASPTSQASTPSEGSSVPQNVRDAFSQVHPSLVEYLSLFPTQSSLAMVDPSRPIVDPSFAHATTNSSPGSSELAPFTPPQSLMGATQGFSMASPTTVLANAFNTSDLSFYSALTSEPPQQSQPMDTDSNTNFFGLDSTSSSNASQPLPHLLNMGFSDEVLMNEQWMNLMRDSGLFDSGPPTSSFPSMQPQNNGAFGPPDLLY